MDPKLVAAAVAALVVLAGGTLLTTQVQGDLEAGVKELGRGAGDPKPVETPPLKLNDLTLPKDLQVQLPKGAEISPDLSKVTLPEDLEIPIPDDLDLSGLDLELPEDFQLDLPAGSVFSPPGLTLPEGATMRLPDGRAISIPAGSKVDLPPEVVQRLLDQGLPAGRLDAPRSLDLAGLPPDLQATLDPPAFEGGGHLRLPGGTTIQLPEGARFPFAAGVLPFAMRYLLPAGTSFDVPAAAASGSLPVPQPRSPSQLIDPATTLIPVETEITQLPASATKGEPFTVGGYVRERGTGKPVPGAPVDIFLNETKRAPGVLVGQTRADVNGQFRAQVKLPDDKPAREYQLVNHAASFTGEDGRVYADAWGDPPIAAVANTQLSFSVPERDGFGVQTLLQGVLLDTTGHPVAGVPVVVSADGASIGRPVTDAEGRFALSYGFSSGVHRVDAQFIGSKSYKASGIQTRSITIDRSAIDIPGAIHAQPGETLTLTGRLLTDGAAVARRAVGIEGLPGDGVTLLTDDTGRFSVTFALPTTQETGAVALTYRAYDLGISKTQLLVVNATGRLSLTAPTEWDAELPIQVTGKLVSTATGRGMAGEMLRFTLSGPGGTSEMSATTSAAGTATLDLRALRPMPGTYTLTLRAVGDPNLDAPAVSQTIALGVFEARFELPSTMLRGEDVTGAVVLRFAGRPYANAQVTLDLLGPMQLTTDAAGRAAFTRTIPADAPLGPTSVIVATLDHDDRATSATVMALPRLALDVPSEFVRDRPLEAELELTDDQGEPLAERDVTLLADGAPLRTVTTDRRGRWSGDLDLGDVSDNVTLAARFNASSPYLATQRSQVVTPVDAPLASTSTLFWALPLVGIAVVGGGAGAWYLHTRRRRISPPAPVGATAAPLALHAPDFDARFGIPDDEPAVWGVGEPLALALRNRGRGGEIELAWNGGASRVMLAEHASAMTTLTFHEEGEVRLVARRAGAEGMADAEAVVRIVDYRKETAREFDLFLEKARALDGSLTRRSTPREIQWTLGGHLGPEAEPPLEEMALAVEITNYSHHEISRAHYLRFVRAARGLDPFLAPEAPRAEA